MKKNCGERNVPLRLLALTVLGAGVSLSLDHFARDPTLASGGFRVLSSPGMAIPFSGSYLVGYVFGLAVVSVKVALKRAASRERQNSIAKAMVGVASRRPRVRLVVLSILIIGLVFFLDYVLVGLSSICVLLGAVSSSVVE